MYKTDYNTISYVIVNELNLCWSYKNYKDPFNTALLLTTEMARLSLKPARNPHISYIAITIKKEVSAITSNPGVSLSVCMVIGEGLNMYCRRSVIS